MKDAHRIYKNDFQRRGRTWSECLTAAWRWEKNAVKTRAEKSRPICSARLQKYLHKKTDGFDYD